VGLFTRTPSTEPADLAERLAQGSVYVLDVRQPSEWRHGHIHGSRNVPLMHVKSQLATLPHNKTIVTVCASGHRSAAAATNPPTKRPPGRKPQRRHARLVASSPPS
jgi:rhodanese-related sulfurtransferase